MNLKQVVYIVILLAFAFKSFSQKVIKGTYSAISNFSATTINFNENFEYKYKYSACLIRHQDSGVYELVGDTILFHSYLKPQDEEYEKITIWNDTKASFENTLIDTLKIKVTNGTKRTQLILFNLKLNDSLLLQAESLKKNEDKYFNFIINLPSDSINIELQVNDKKITLSNVREAFFNIVTDNWIIYKPIDDKMIYKRNKMYSVNFFNTTKKKYYIHKKTL